MHTASTIHIRSGSRRLLLLGLAIAAAGTLALVNVGPAGSAIPASAAVGKVTYVDLNGTTDVTNTIRSFSIDAVHDPDAQNSGGGGVFGAPIFGKPRVVHDVVARSPWIMSAVSLGRHLPSITVTLYRPSSTTPYQTWTFEDVQFADFGQSQVGPASATPWETVTWVFEKVRQTTYLTDGVTQSTTFCWDASVRHTC